MNRLTSAISSFLVVAVFLSAGCATIMQGSTQQVSVSSTPTQAQVSVNGLEKGTTPVVMDLKRKDNHTIRVSLDGYEPYEMGLTRSTSGWVWGNLVFGGLPGLAVDAITGGLYKLSPEQIQAELSRGEEQASNDSLYLFVVLEPRVDWELIDRLEPEVR